MSFHAISPIDGRVLSRHPLHGEAEVRARIAAAARAAAAWRASSHAERRARLLALAALLRADAPDLARLAALEMGKPVREARAEVEKCALCCEHFARHAEAMLAPEEVATEARRSLVRFDPLGLVLAIMPWNFPYWQFVRCAAPALAAGNGVLLKHAPNVPGCAERLEDLATRAGFPAGLVANLRIEVEGVPAILADPRVAALSFTGSVRGGRAVARLAGENGKKCVLELGGSDAFVVLADADLERAADAGARSRCLNAGQSCIAAKRFLIEESVYADFAGRLRERMARLRMGDPLLEEVEIGPIARADLRDALHRQVRESVAAGAELLLGGELPEGPGFFYPPTLLGEVRPGMPAFDQETFGPVAALVRVRDAEQALELANASEYGLGASLWTTPERGLELAARIEAGSVFVGDFVKSDPRLPFGGVKSSGHGRELSRHGLMEFVNAKTVWVA